MARSVVFDTEKLCGNCRQVKPRSDFNLNTAKSDGLQYRCRACQKIEATAPSVRAQKRAYRATDRGKQVLKASRKKYDTSEKGRRIHAVIQIARHRRDPLKKPAQNALNRAIASGLLTRRPCEVCGEEYTHGHHPDYTKPLEVVWLCPQHHSDEHRRLRLASKLSVGG
jgi:hypothetical protein